MHKEKKGRRKKVDRSESDFCITKHEQLNSLQGNFPPVIYHLPCLVVAPLSRSVRFEYTIHPTPRDLFAAQPLPLPSGPSGDGTRVQTRGHVLVTRSSRNRPAGRSGEPRCLSRRGSSAIAKSHRDRFAAADSPEGTARRGRKSPFGKLVSRAPARGRVRATATCASGMRDRAPRRATNRRCLRQTEGMRRGARFARGRTVAPPSANRGATHAGDPLLGGWLPSTRAVALVTHHMTRAHCAPVGHI